MLASTVIKAVTGHTGEVYRRGGDEFIIISPKVDEPTADALAEKLRSELELAFCTWSKEHNLTPAPTASIGVANIDAGISPSNLIALVDSAQKRAKDLGKNRVCRERTA